jgi:hypothetical protein
VAWEVESPDELETWEFVPRADHIYARNPRALEKE